MSSSEKYVRVWKKFNADNARKQILYIDDIYGTCGNCKHLGLNFVKDKTCPSCKTTFRYLITVSKKPEDIGKILARIEKENLSLELLERDDFEKSDARSKADDLFKKQ